VIPTAGGDAEEAERFLMMDALGALLGDGRIKVYSCDSVAGRAWVSREGSPRELSRIQNQFDAFLYYELVPAIREDCRTPDIEVVAAGSSIGAFNALAAVCRHPDVFSTALCLSGTYDLEKYLDGQMNLDFYYSSPLHFLPSLGDGEQLQRLRGRFVLLAYGGGRWESPEESWRVANLLGSKGVPNRVDAWGEEYDHDWPTWRHMLPHYLERLLEGRL
jgi:esterase/lipase superfamily enzyme